jgi:hypothetical protein
MCQAEEVMSVHNLFRRKSGSSGWVHQVAGVVLAGVGIIGVSQPTAKVSMHCLEDAAVYRLAPVMKKSDMGRQFLAMYAKSDTACHKTI